MVFYQEGSYISLDTVTNETPGTSAKWQLIAQGVSSNAIQAAVNDYLDEHGVENLMYEALDYALSGEVYSPSLKIDNTVDQTYNPNGHYIMYYRDSDDERHNLFDFSNVFYTKSEIDAMLSNP